jgi:hypothetical protein
MRKIFTIIFVCTLLSGLLFIQKYFTDNSLFKQYPYTGEFLHFSAGICVVILINIFLGTFCPYMVLTKRILFILLGALVIEITWEFIEVLLGWNNRQTLVENVMNTLEDVVVTIVGALVGVLFFVQK